MKDDINYTLGLDLGIASIGWAVIGLGDDEAPTHIVDVGVIIPESMEDDKGNLKNADRRGARGARRTIRRKQFRVKRIKKLVSEELKISNIDDVYLRQNISVYELKVKGLKEKLTEEELAKVLIHYAKHRGFKSNRKHETSQEDGTILKAIKENEKKMDGFVSEYILERLNGIDKVKNQVDYEFSFSRDKIKEEIETLLDKQNEYNVITEDFKDRYLDIFSSQRDFSEGPGGESEYKVDFAKVFGYCHFDGELRAPRFAVSQEINTGLSKLLNLRYKIGEKSDYEKLSKEQIQAIMKRSETKKEIKYSDVSKVLVKDKNTIITYKGLKLEREKFIKIINEIKEEDSLEGKVDYRNNEKFKEKQFKEFGKKVLFKREANFQLREAFKEKSSIEKYEQLPVEYKDDIITGMTFYKTDEKISLYFSGNEVEQMKTSDLDWDLYSEIRDSVIPHVKGSSFKESAGLSLNILRELNEIMLKEAMEYSEAMKKLGYDHSQLGVHKEIEKKEKLDDLIKILEEQYPNEISNPRVIRILKNCQNLINACIDKYGSPNFINIEVARDINLKRGKRAILEKEQLSNLDRNERIKSQIMEDTNIGYNSISKYDIEKYKLYEEQGGICPYSLEKIEKGNILTNMYQIDHIVPYSKSRLNTYINKTLVKKSENHEKGDKVPLEFLSDSKKTEFISYIENNHKISDKKKTLYLLKTLSDFEESFSSGAIEDTRFITKYLKKILDDNLIFKESERAIKVRSFKAGYVNTIKKLNKVNNYTHSHESADYKRRERIKYQSQDLDLKNNKITFNFSSEQKEYKVDVKVEKETEKMPYEKKQRNTHLQKIIDNSEKIEFENFCGRGLSLHTTIFDEIKKLDISGEIKQSLEYILTYAKAQVEKERIKKNRNNHLHHVLDAVAVATINKSMEQKLAKYEKKKGEAIDKLNKEPLTVKLNDEIKTIETVAEFEKMELKYLQEYIPKPFENFENEIIAYIYERDIEKQRIKLNDDKIRNIKPLFPVIRKNKRYSKKGEFQQLHKDIVYGRVGDVLVKRIDVKDLKEKNIEKIIGKDSYAKSTYESCKKWLSNKDKDKDTYPLLPNGRKIKKVKIEDGDAKKTFKIKRGYVKGDVIVRIDIYKSKDENDDKLYCLGQNSLTMALDNAGKNEERKQMLWYAQNKCYELTNAELKDKFKLLKYLHPGDLIHIITRKDKQTLAYVKGFTCGSIEIESPLGDNYDLHKDIDHKIDKTQFYVTVSSIKQINRKKINIMGEILN